MQEKGKELIRNLKLYSDYLKWNNTLNRYEKWEEACVDVLNTNLLKYGEKVRPLINEILPSYIDGDFLTSQRMLQFRNEQIIKNNARLYNCSVMYAYAPDCFNKGFFLLLSGCGLGVHLGKKYINKLPTIDKRKNEIVEYVVPDSIEGWSDSIKILISSYCKHESLVREVYGKQIKFDFSLIREEGSFISGGFSAPGHKGLKNSLELIESFLERELKENSSIKFRSYIVYNIFMHLSNAVLSGGVRRSAMNVIIDKDDDEMLYAKTGNWRSTNPHFARSNNSVGLLKYNFTKEEFQKFIDLNTGDNDLGFVLLESEDQIFNPCFEVGFDFYNKIKNYNHTAIQLCNLTEGNASNCLNKKGVFEKERFLKICRVLAIQGTLQAGFTTFPYLGSETEEIVSGEALLGCGITGWMNVPELFNPELLREGVEVIRKTNLEVSKLIGIHQAARLTVVKPSGNASVILKTPSGIHPEHSKRYFRIMQINKNTEVAKYLEEKLPFLIEESVWSSTKSDYVVFCPIENPDEGKFKNSLTDIEHLKLIKLVQENWIFPGTNKHCAYNPNIHHNVSNTVLIDDKKAIVDYIFDNQKFFVAVSFLDRFGDKDFNQAPFTSVLTGDELFKTYGDAVYLVSGLIVDGLDVFNNNLWEACDYLDNKDLDIIGLRKEKLLKKDWLNRAKKFSKNYFKGDSKKLIYCLKDVHLFHKWQTINRELKPIDFTEILKKPNYKNMDEMGAMSCNGGSCEIVRL